METNYRNSLASCSIICANFKININGIHQCTIRSVPIFHIMISWNNVIIERKMLTFVIPCAETLRYVYRTVGRPTTLLQYKSNAILPPLILKLKKEA